jgi:hypothetical protein
MLSCFQVYRAIEEALSIIIKSFVKVLLSCESRHLGESFTIFKYKGCENMTILIAHFIEAYRQYLIKNSS